MFQIIQLCTLFIFGFNQCQCFDESWYSYQRSARNASREELVIKNVTAEKSYALKSNVTRWKSLTIGPTCYTVGLLDTGLYILITDLYKNRTGFGIVGPGEIDLKEKPSDVTLFHNRINGQSEAVVVVSFVENSNLIWIKLTPITPIRIVTDFWSWSLEEPVIHINSLNMKGKQVMLVVSDNTRANLYEFDIKSEHPTYWYLQSLNLSTLAKSSAFSSFESDFFLAIPQASFNSVLIYKYLDNHFVYENSIVSPKVTTVTSFEIGFKSFLTVDGYNSGIYEFTKDGLLERKIINSNSEGIHYWLPVPIQTYRDEVILFAQRSLDHGTHKTYVVEIITYNGGQFEEHEDVPCSLFEESSHWLTCLTHDNGIIGASYIAIGEKLGLIVSKPSKSSFVIFMVHSTMRSMPHPKTNELELLNEHKDSLQKLINEQMKEYEELVNIKSELVRDLTDTAKTEEHLVGVPEEDISKYEEEIQALGLDVDEAMKKIAELKEKENQTEFDTVIVNGILKIQGNLDVGQVEVGKINEEPATELLEDIARKDGLSKLFKNKTFTDFEVNDLNFDVVNGINASNIIFNDEDEIVLKGNIVFEKPVVLNQTFLRNGLINDFDIRKEVVEMRKGHNGTLQFEEIEVLEKMKAMKINNLNLHPIGGTSSEDDGEHNDETSFIPHNISVTTINGVDFSNFINDLCLVNVKCYIPGNTTIIQDATVNEMHTNYLNDLKFPEEFILADSVSHANITARKKFEGTLIAREIRSEGTLGGVDTNKLVTLSTNQHIPGKLTFKDLELTEELNVTGNILGEHIGKFMSNPTLEETDLIKSNINFRRLEVEGNITLENDFNAESFEELLKDFVYLDEETSQVTGSKIFSKGLTVHGNLGIESNSINNVDLNSLVTKNSEQNLQINFLNGAVTIDNLQVNGTYDGINIAQFDESLVKLTGEQFIASTLIFTDDVVVENLEVTGKLNELEADEYLYTSGDIEISKDVAFDKIVVENLLVQGNLTGNISNLDLLDFSERYLSFTKNQTIDARFHLGSSEVDDLNAGNVNGLRFGDLFNHSRLLDTIKQMLNNRTSKVENLVVDGSINLKTINNKNINELIISRNLFTTGTGSIKKELIIENDVYFNNLEIDKLSSVGWNDFVRDIVFKNETTLEMSGTKTFGKGIAVGKLIETTKIDGILLDDILTKEGSQQIDGPLIIRANVTLEDSVVSDSINETPIKDIFDSINVSEGVRVHKGDMVFERIAHIKNLFVDGMVNNKLPDQVLQTIVYKNSAAIMDEDIIFKKPVNVSGNIHVDFINNINLTDIKSNIVLTTTDAEISGIVSFSEPVLIQNGMRVDESFITDFLLGFNTDEWLNKAVFLNKGLLSGNYSFENIVINEELLTIFINDIDTRKMIPLRSDQSVGTLAIEEVSYVNNISVGNLVNGFKLSAAFQNTVMGNLDQEIDSDLIFENNILVRNVLTAPTINGHFFSNMVTTNTDQNLTSAFNFVSKCTVESDLEVHGLINRINFTSWKTDYLRLSSNKSQGVTNLWNVANNFSFSDDVAGNGSIGGFDLPLIAKEVAERRDYKYKFEKGIIDDYNNICTDVTYLYEKTKTQIYKFKYFDDLQQLSFQHNIKHVFYFDHKNYNYLLINEENCLSHMFVFNGSVFRPLIENIATGSIEQVVPVFDEDGVFLVIRGVSKEEKCNVVGTNIWKFTDNNLDLIMNMDDQLLLQESLLPKTFYALNVEGVTEYKLKKGFGGYKKYRKWEIFEDNVAFMPRGLKSGLALRTGRKIIYLDQSDPIVEDDVDDNVEVTIRGESRSIDNYFIPGKNGSELVVLTVGVKSARKKLLAVATHEETVIKARLDFVKIYGNGIKGELFDKVPTYKASSLLSIDFEQSETLLVFLENRRVLQVYEYKGIEGFKHRTSVKIPGSKLFQMSLPIKSCLNPRKTIGIIQKNKIRLLQAVMDGNLIRGDLNCGL